VFDTWSVQRPLTEEMPASVPQRPMGEIPVIVRLVWPDGEECRPAFANRWTATHVLVRWHDEQERNRHQYSLVWLRAEDVSRSIRPEGNRRR
jgi:hypothetical protein